MVSNATRHEPYETHCKRIMVQHALAKIELSLTNYNVHARAIPSSFNPIASKKRQDAIDKLGARAGLNIIAQVSQKSMQPIAAATGATIEAALTKLELELDEQQEKFERRLTNA